jgi:uncharacterized protein YcbK (DUF882 family)
LIYDKGAKKRVNANFHSDSFDCHCSNASCSTTIVDPILATALDELWELVGEFKINSGYRCKKHNTAINGKSGSYHLLGMAVDIESLRGFSGPQLAKFVLEIPEFEHGGLGVSEHWLHCDVRKVRARWTYPINTH